jgi:hypothetical protein
LPMCANWQRPCTYKYTRPPKTTPSFKPNDKIVQILNY